MAGLGIKIRTDPIATGTSALTVLQVIAAANHAVLVNSISVSFAGTSNTAAPIKVDVLRQTTAGTMTTAASTVVKDPEGLAETIQTTRGDSASAEPTAGDILHTEHVHPQTGWEWRAGGSVKPIRIAGGGRLGVRVTAAASVNCVVTVNAEE